METKDIIFKVLVGSHAYGTNIEGSDEDIKGIYIQSPEDNLQNGYREQYSVGKDETYYEIKRFVELCCTGNPTMLEVLYSPENCILFKDSIFDVLLKNRDKFLSKSCKWSFGGYAYSQIEKAKGLNKKMNWEKDKIERKSILDFCYVLIPIGSQPLKIWLHQQKDFFSQKQDNYGVSKIPNCRDMYYIFLDNEKESLKYTGICNLEETSNELRLCTIPISETAKGIPMSYNKDGYMEHCKDYKSYQEWLKNRNIQRYVDVKEHGQKIDGKNLLHCYRLIETGIEIAQQKTINVRRPNAEFLIEIRKGKHDLDKLLAKTSGMIEDLNKEFDKSTLQDKVDRGYFLSLIVKIRKQFYEKTKEK